MVRELGIESSTYYQAMKGELVSPEVYALIEKFVLEHRITVKPVEGPGINSELSKKARDFLVDAFRQNLGDESD